MKPQSPREAALVLPIIGALATAIAPHLPGMPVWITFWCLGMWGYMLARLKTGWPLPVPLVRYGLIFSSLVGLMFTSQLRLGGDSFVGLLALMAAIKPFEMTTHRHRMITILLTYFIIITSLVRSDSIFIVLYMFISVYVTTTALIRINNPKDSFRESRKLAGAILAQSIPLMMILFLIFPRMPGSLLGFEDKKTARSGFSDTLSPGSVSRLVQDPSTAFRVDFKDGIPRTDQLYWRAIVFHQFDGRSWSISPPPGQTPFQIQGETSSIKKEITYTILLEPHSSPWLVSLDRPIEGPAWAELGSDNTLKARQPVKQSIQYQVKSILPEPGAGSMDPETRRVSAKMPALAAAMIKPSGNINPGTRELARELAGTGDSPASKAEKLLSHFREKGFVYTLTPPRLEGKNPIDQFLLKSKKGYCEHYASAFAFMMNVLDVPARVAGGYLGGEFNPYGNHLIVRQAYAHVWVEIFDPALGWMRMDPTMAVAPDRIQVNPDGSSVSLFNAPNAIGFYKKLQYALDAVNLKWEAWFTGYSHRDQMSWLKKAGLGESRGLKELFWILIAMTLGSLGIFSGILVWFYLREKPKTDPVTRYYLKFCKKLAPLGLVKSPAQGPMDFAKNCSKKRPDLEIQVNNITQLYISLKYAPFCPRGSLSEFKTRVRTFYPARIAPGPIKYQAEDQTKACSPLGKKIGPDHIPDQAPKNLPARHISVGIVRKKEMILITRRKQGGHGAGLWEFPGGMVERKETAKEACIREILEETGLKIKIESLLTRISHDYPHFKIEMDVFNCQYISGQVRLNGPVDYKWIGVKDLEKYSFPRANMKFLPLVADGTEESLNFSRRKMGKKEKKYESE